MAELTDKEIRNILKSYGEDIGPITHTTRNIYIKKIESLKKSNPTKNVRKSEPIFSSIPNWTPPHKTNAPKTPVSNNNQYPNLDRNIRKEPILNPPTQTVNAFGSISDSPGRNKFTNNKSPDPIFINKCDRKPFRNSTVTLDRQVNIEDKYCKELKGRVNSPISLTKNYENNYYPPTEQITTNFINQYRTETNCPQVNGNNNKKWYNGSLNTISNYFGKHKRNDDLMDISDGDLSDNESNLMTRLRKNYFKKTGSSDANNSKLKQETLKKTDSFFSNQLPNILLMAGLIILLLIFGSYLMMKSRYSHIELDIAIDDLICKDNSLRKTCFTSVEMPKLKKYLGKLYDILSEYSGEKTCEFSTNKKLPYRKARDLLNNKLKRGYQEEINDEIWNKLMKLVIMLPQDKLEIVGYSNEHEVVDSNKLPEHITYLECLKPKLSIICRLKMACVTMMNWIFYILFILLIIILVLALGYSLNLYRLKRKEIKEKHISELKEVVSRISDLLQDQLRQSEYSPTIDKFLPLTKIRSILQQTHPKLRDNRFWEDIKKFMYKSEPLIEMKETIAHGEILEWKSYPGWQGSAVQSECEVKFEKGPTECLKIRNMDIANFNENGQNYLRREVMNRIKDAGEVMDIRFLLKGQKVIVYVMCASREVAGRAFRKINANYFNGHLLNVKFIRMDKYLERFPESKNLC